jgi:hypothetical protein
VKKKIKSTEKLSKKVVRKKYKLNGEKSGLNFRMIKENSEKKSTEK